MQEGLDWCKVQVQSVRLILAEVLYGVGGFLGGFCLQKKSGGIHHNLHSNCEQDTSLPQIWPYFIFPPQVRPEDPNTPLSFLDPYFLLQRWKQQCLPRGWLNEFTDEVLHIARVLCPVPGISHQCGL